MTFESDRDLLPRTPPLLVASLEDVPADADPCEISASGGYQLLENQLYRVQIHDGEGGTGAFRTRRNDISIAANRTFANDRILVCRQGRIVEEFSPADATEEKIMYAAVH